MTSAAIVATGSSVNDESKCSPAEAKKSGTNSPSEALRIPGMMSARTCWGSPDRAAPNSSAPMVPCSPNSSAATTTRNKQPMSNPMSNPNESSGTLRSRWRRVIAAGSTLVERIQAATTKPTIWANNIGDDRTQAESAEDSLQELRDNNQQPDGEKDL